MKNRFSLVISCAVAMAALSVSAAVPPYDKEAQLVNAKTDVVNWMKYLPDDVYVAHVSIPGTHDTATAEGWSSATGSTMSTTQEKTIDEQLAGGVRAFDFRPGLEGSGSNQYLNCNHGADATKLRFADALKKLTDYLDAHPSEFFVIHLFRGNVYATKPSFPTYLVVKYSDSDKQKYAELMDELLNKSDVSNYIVDYSPYLKVKDMRGKIVMFRRDRIDWVHLEKAGNLTNWPADDEVWSASNFVTATNATNPALKGVIYATDVSSPDNETELNTELESITNLYKRNCSQVTPNEAKAQGSYKPEWSMIFTSGAYEGENTKGYLKNATHTNPLLTSLLRTDENVGPTGVVFSDWVLTDSHDSYATMGVDLVPAIIENNFRYIDRFILDDELFNENPDLNVDLFEGKEYFMRNVGTGQFLTAGADWGTHTAIGNFPIRVTPSFIKVTNTYTFKTTFRQGNVDNFIGSNYFVDNSNGQEFKAVYTGNGNIYYFVADGANEAMTAMPVSGYADGTEYIVNPANLESGNTMQQWKMITAEEYLAEQVLKASPENGVDLSFLARGGHFMPNDGDNWTGTTNYKETITGAIHASYIAAEGTNAWNDKELVLHCHNTSSSSFYNSNTVWSIAHSITGLPKGKYKLSLLGAHYNFNLSETTLTFNINGVEMRTSLEGVGSNDAAAVVAEFRNDPSKYTVTMDLTVGDDGMVTFKMAKAKTNSVTGLFIDNITLTYYGPAEMEAIEYVPQDEYDTLILPFDHQIPDGMGVYSAFNYSECKDDYYVVELIPDEKIKANTPYVVRYMPQERAAAEPYKFWGVKSSDTADTYSNGLLTGSHVDMDVPANKFCLRRIDDANMAFARVSAADSDAFITAHRAYLSDEADEALNAEDSKIHLIRFEVLPDDSTGLENVSAAVGIDAGSPVDVYTVSGMLLRSGAPYAEALDSLASGIYLVRCGGVTVKVAK